MSDKDNLYNNKNNPKASKDNITTLNIEKGLVKNIF